MSYGTNKKLVLYVDYWSTLSVTGMCVECQRIHEPFAIAVGTHTMHRENRNAHQFFGKAT